MKNNLIAFLGFAILFSNQSFAQDILTCHSVNNPVETTVVVRENAGAYVMTIYQVAYGHTFEPRDVSVRSLPGAQGAVSAFGNQQQSRLVSYNFNSKSGSFFDTLAGQSISVVCK